MATLLAPLAPPGDVPEPDVQPDVPPAPVIPEPDPTHTPVIPEPDPTHTPVLPEPGEDAGRWATGPLSSAVAEALDGCATRGAYLAAGVPAADERDELCALTLVHQLHLAPVPSLGRRVRWQHHPAVAALKRRLEVALLRRVDAGAARELPPPAGDTTVARVRAVAAHGLVPPVYRWLASAADEATLRQFLALEGGPDGGFDDLVAMAQVGLDGEAKLELATNYWDEMGRGEAPAVHTELHHRMARALALPTPGPDEVPVAALRRGALSATLATNRSLQAEQLGALGLLELQAGPRCRQVVAALRRLGAGPDALAFYEEHAVADPRHGKAWLERVVATLGDDPWWSAGMVRGARWRAWTNDAFFRAAAEVVGGPTA